MAISLMDFVNTTSTPLMRGLVQIVTNTSKLMKRMRFIPVDGFAYSYNREQTLGGIAFRNLNQNYSDVTPAAAGATATGVINPEVETLAIFGGEVRTDKQLINKNGDAIRSSRIASKMKRAALFFDKYLIQGDPAVTPGSFYGLNARLTGKQVIVSGDGLSSDVSAGGTGTITINMVVAAQDAVVGADNENKVLVMNKNVRRNLSAEVRKNARGMGVYDAAGTQLQKFNGSDIETLDEDGDDQPVLTNTETYGGATNTASLYCIRFGDEIDESNVQGLVGSNMIEHDAVGLLGTYFLDIVEGNLGVAVFHPRAASRLIGINTAQIADLTS